MKIILFIRFFFSFFLLAFSSQAILKAQNFNLLANGVTVECTAASVGDTSVIGGVIYTKRAKEQVTRENASSSCTSGITDMSGMFLGAVYFNGDISSWDVSNVEYMASMFEFAESFNGDISSWDVSNVTDMASMFEVAPSFNGDISSWDVSNVTDMTSMFRRASSFSSVLIHWDVSSVTNMDQMFDQLDISYGWGLWNWCVPLIPNEPVNFANNVIEYAPKWGNCPGFRSDYLGNITCKTADVGDSVNLLGNIFIKRTAEQITTANAAESCTSGITDMSSLFKDSTTFDIDISSWDVGDVTNMDSMFFAANAFNQDLSSWKVDSVRSMKSMFFEAYVFNQDLSSWKVDSVRSMKSMFFEAYVFNQDLSSWNVSSVTNMDSMFYRTYAFNQDIGSWNVSSVTNMDQMFYRASSFNQDLRSWCVSLIGNEPINYGNTGLNPEWGACPNPNFEFLSNRLTYSCEAASVGDTSVIGGVIYTKRAKEQVTTENASSSCTSGITDMSGMFQGASIFNRDISSWDVSNVTDMQNMFSGSSAFNGDISSWDVSNVTDMQNMFSGAYTFAGDLSTWDVGSVTNMSSMFVNTNVFNSILSEWNVSSVVNMEKMFFFATSFNGDLSSWDVSSVTNMEWLFRYAYAFDQDLSGWNVSGVTNMGSMFLGAKAFNGIIGAWDVGSVTNMSSMFNGANLFNQDLSNWNVSNVESMASMFEGAARFNEDISNWDVSSVTDMSSMFYDAFNDASRFNQDINSWDVSSVTNMSSMFNGANLFNQNLSNWNVSNVTNMSSMFQRASVFNGDVSTWDVSSVTNMSNMFSEVSVFNGEIGAWNVGSVTNMFFMFSGASLFNQDLSKWCVSLVGSEPPGFSYASLLTNVNKPIWGTCPGAPALFTLTNPNLITYPDSVLTIHESFFTINPNYVGSTFTFKVSGTYTGDFYSDNNDNMVFDTGDEYITSSNGVELGSTPLRYLNTSAGYSSPKFHLSVGAESDSSKVLLASVVTQPQIQGIANEGGWYLLANPFSTSIGELLDNVWTQGAINSDAPGGSPTLYTFDEQTAAYQAITGDITTDTLEAGEGLLAYLYAFDDVNAGIPEGGGWPKTLINAGNPFGGSITIPIKNVDISGSPTGTSGAEGFKLFGNPFSWDLSIDSLVTALIAIDEFTNRYIYTWDPLLKEYQIKGSGAIKAYESVFIRTITSGLDANITLEYDDFYQAAPAKTILEQPFKFVLHHLDEGLESRSQLLFTEQASVDIDPLDGYYLGSYASKYANLYTQIGDQNLSINNLPTDLSEPIELPLYMDASVSGAFELDWNSDLLPTEWAFTLEEVSTGIVIDLKQQDYVSFTNSVKAKLGAKRSELSPIKNLTPSASSKGQSEAPIPVFILRVNPFISTGTDVGLGLPTKMELAQNYPNPFNPSTTIQYALSEQHAVTLEVFNLMGQKVSELVQSTQSAGNYSVTFDASQLSSGVYIYRLQAGSNVFIKKMTLIK